MNRREFVVGGLALACAPRAFAAARSPVALVTADEESRLVVIDLASGKVLRHVPTLASPRSIETVGETAVVAHSEHGAVSLVRDLEVVRVLRGFGEPRYTAAHPDGRHAYVTDAARGEVVALDVVRGRVVAREQVGARARHITISPNGRDAVGRARLEGARRSRSSMCRIERGRSSSARSGRRFSRTMSAGRRTAPRLGELGRPAGARGLRRAHRPRRRAPRGDWPPQHVTFAGRLAYVTSGWSGTVRVHRVDGRELRRNPVPLGSYNVQAAAGRV